MWTVENRRAYERTGLHYPSDLSDVEWALVGAADPARQARRTAARGGCA